MKYIKAIVLYLLLVMQGVIYAKQPAFFILGEEKFKGVQIYDIIQDKEFNYWIATNEGLYFYNHYTYEKIECQASKSISVFNLVIDNNGVIYCHNLNNQIFVIKNKTCELFYELKPDESSPDISLDFTSNNQLIIGARKIIIVSENGIVTNRISIQHRYLGPPFRSAEGVLYYHLGDTDTILIIKGNHHSRKVLKYPSKQFRENGVIKFFNLNKKVYAINLSTKTLFLFDLESYLLQPLTTNPIFSRSKSIRLYNTKNYLWSTGTLSGVALIDDSPEKGNYNLLYDDYFISNVFEDNEGNILLSTFNKGILVIPNMKIYDVIHSFKQDPITSLLFTNDDKMYLGSSKGFLLEYQNNSFKTLNQLGKKPIEHLHTHHNFPFIIFDDGFIRAYSKRNNRIYNICDASLKDVVFTSDSSFYLGTNRGLIKCSVNKNNLFSFEYIKEVNQRIYSLSFDEKINYIYAATSNGLYVLDSKGQSRKILYHHEELYPHYIANYLGKTYVAHKKGGLLIIEQDQVKQEIPFKINNQTTIITNFVFYQRQIIVNCNKGLYLFDLNGNLIHTLNSYQNFSSNRVINFYVNKNLLYVIHANGLQQINLNELQDKQTPPLIQLTNVLVNNIPIDFINKSIFNTNERKIQFILSSPSLLNKSNTFYYYKLDGIDAQWNINEYNNHTITYNALAPGKYTFLVKAERQGVFSKTISYTFSIAKPFYSEWWFITLCVGIFLTCVYFIYRWRLNIQNKKAQQINELNESKLTAIKSQMNPHFIFNSLNSIQDLILKGDVEHSYSYISTFSDLVRRTLNYSDKDFISFEEEIQLLQLYLSLEGLRFKKDFSYNLETNHIVDIEIPPMLIQPFIENSLVHGLLHQEGMKKLNISFELKEELLCIIEDNGIGRQESKKIKQRQHKTHESFSSHAINKRFEILSKVFVGKFGFIYHDLENNSGTRVILTLPFKRKF